MRLTTLVMLISVCGSTTSFGPTPILAQESRPSSQAPAGWFLAGSKPASYRTGVDTQVVYDGRPSAYLASQVQDTKGFGTLMQSIAATKFAGQRIRLQAWVKSSDVASWAGLWMRVDKGASTVAFDNMQTRAIHGTQSWTSYEVVLDVPEDATGISFGTLLDGPGQVWISAVRLDVVGMDIQTTDTLHKLPETPVNLDFQQ